MNPIRGHARGITLGNRKAQESQVSILWNGGTLRIMNKKGGDLVCDHDARFVREQLVSYVGNIVGTKGEGRREPFSLLVKTRRTNWQSSSPSVVTEMSSTMVTGLLTE